MLLNVNVSLALGRRTLLFRRRLFRRRSFLFRRRRLFRRRGFLFRRRCLGFVNTEIDAFNHIFNFDRFATKHNRSLVFDAADFILAQRSGVRFAYTNCKSKVLIRSTHHAINARKGFFRCTLRRSRGKFTTHGFLRNSYTRRPFNFFKNKAVHFYKSTCVNFFHTISVCRIKRLQKSHFPRDGCG